MTTALVFGSVGLIGSRLLRGQLDSPNDTRCRGGAQALCLIITG